MLFIPTIQHGATDIATLALTRSRVLFAPHRNHRFDTAVGGATGCISHVSSPRASGTSGDVGAPDDDADMEITLMQPEGLVVSPAFSHVAVVPPGATTIYVGGQNGVDDTGAVVSADAGEQSLRAVENARVALEAAGARLEDVISWTVLIHQDADLRSAYGAVASKLARDGAPPLVTAALVAGLGVPGALIEVSAVAAIVLH